jgi:hypothetical protein
MKLPARLWKRLEALERPGPGPDDEINAILREYRGMKALLLAIEKARELEGERTKEDDDAIKNAVGLTGMKKLRQDMLRDRDKRRSGEV